MRMIYKATTNFLHDILGKSLILYLDKYVIHWNLSKSNGDQQQYPFRKIYVLAIWNKNQNKITFCNVETPGNGLGYVNIIWQLASVHLVIASRPGVYNLVLPCSVMQHTVMFVNFTHTHTHSHTRTYIACCKCWTQGQSGWVQTISLPPGFDTQTIHPVASHYTDHTPLANSVCIYVPEFQCVFICIYNCSNLKHISIIVTFQIFTALCSKLCSGTWCRVFC